MSRTSQGTDPMPDISDVQFRYNQVDLGERRPQHEITASRDNEEIGRLRWHGVTHRVTGVFVNQEHARQGIATHMWNMSQGMRPKARHSPDRTAMGNAWAKSVGGRLPNLAKVDTNEYSDGDWDPQGNPIRR